MNEKAEFCRFIDVDEQDTIPYNRYRIHLSQPLKPELNNLSQLNPFANIQQQLGINISKLRENGEYLKIRLSKEDNEIKKIYDRKKNLVGSLYLESLQDKNYYPIARKSIILNEPNAIHKNEGFNSKFEFLYKNFHKIQSNLHQTLSAFPNRPNDFVNQFGLNLRTESQDHFLSILYNLNFDILYSSHYLLSNLVDEKKIAPPKNPTISIMECLTKPFLAPENPFFVPEEEESQDSDQSEDFQQPKNLDQYEDPQRSERIKRPIGYEISDIENVTDIFEFKVAINCMRKNREQIQKFTKPISSRCSKKVLMSSTPTEQNFISVYNDREKLSNDSVPRADIFTYIGLRIRKRIRQESDKTLIGWSETRIPTRRMLLTNQEMFFEKRKATPLSHGRSGSNSSFSSMKTQNSQFSQMSQVSQASQISTMSSSQASQASASGASSSGASGSTSLWNKEQSNPFTGDIFKSKTVTVISKTRIEKKSNTETTTLNINGDKLSSDSESSFY